ncbi:MULTISPECIES: KOW domain-containing RNA-binding protein [Paenibacillus]|uniref:Ribosome-binding protein YbzG n=1 Tax=Paenibacillus radicis (ex Gao et al. 2016) TaxID=1737354 RepID=A0A917HV87_9BACL|nr:MULTISPECIES: KOW domain-containing RNA-binding protein [Paenibacillus]GGG90363.1 putative ribosome-binding protein YbzG [Paenibacillus radicis (ex Gao et al. 2016)]
MEKQPQVGQIVKVLRGKDENSYAIILTVVDERFVMIVDGDKRRFDQPKKKNVLHLELQPVISSEVTDSLLESGRVTNAKLRYVIQKYAHAKGE